MGKYDFSRAGEAERQGRSAVVWSRLDPWWVLEQLVINRKRPASGRGACPRAARRREDRPVGSQRELRCRGARGPPVDLDISSRGKWRAATRRRTSASPASGNDVEPRTPSSGVRTPML